MFKWVTLYMDHFPYLIYVWGKFLELKLLRQVSYGLVVLIGTAKLIFVEDVPVYSPTRQCLRVAKAP